MTRGQANVIRAFCIWTVYVWVTRIWNIWNDASRNGAFKAVHTVICVISVGLAIASWIVVSHVRRKRLAADALAPKVDSTL
jgi:hypothetical protein